MAYFIIYSVFQFSLSLDEVAYLALYMCFSCVLKNFHIEKLCILIAFV